MRIYAWRSNESESWPKKNQVSQNKILARVWSYNDCQTPTETTLKKEGNTQETKSDWTGYNTYTSVYFTSKTTARGKITRLFSRLTSPWKVYVSHQRQWRKNSECEWDERDRLLPIPFSLSLTPKPNSSSLSSLFPFSIIKPKIYYVHGIDTKIKQNREAVETTGSSSWPVVVIVVKKQKQF